MKNFGKICIALSAGIVFAFAGCSNSGGGSDSPQVVHVSGVTLNKSTLTLDVDTSEKLIATVSPDNAFDKSVTWLSSDTEIVTVTEDGMVKAVSDGTGSSGDTATVTVRTTDGAKTASCTVKVGPAGTVVPVASITLSDTSVTMQKDKTKIITATVLPATATDTTVSWSVSGSAVSLSAATGSSVTVTAKDGGQATVTAQAGNKTALCTVTVEAPLSVRVTRADGSRYTVSEIDKLDLTKESDSVDVVIFGAWRNDEVKTLGTKIKDSNANVSLDMTAATGITQICYNYFAGSYYGYFQYCTKLTNIRLPVSVTEIQSNAFSGCTALRELTLGTAVTKIAYDALGGCSALKSFSISDGTFVTDDFYKAARFLKDCTNLESVTITHTAGNTTGIAQKIFAGKNIKTLVVSDGVPKIENEIFKGCTALTTVSVAGSVRSIGTSAFAGCAALSNLTLNDGIEEIGAGAFNGCAALVDIMIPDSVTVIDGSAFINCTALTKVTLGKNLTTLGSNAFARCGALKTVVFSEAGDSGNLIIGESAFGYCSALADISLPASLTKVGVKAFVGCTALESISIYDSLKTVDVRSSNEEPLYNCPNLNKAVVRHAAGNTEGWQGNFFYKSAVKEVVIEEGVTSIPKESFTECKNLTTITIPSSVETIGEKAFYFCEKLTAVTLPKKLRELGGGAFYKCSALSSLKIDDSQLSVLNGSVFSGCSALTAVTLPPGITSIEPYAFSNCTNLEIETLPPNLKTIGKEVFSGTKLKKVMLPDTVTSIGKKAFYNCTALKTISIGKGAVTVGEKAFADCTALHSLTISESDAVKTLEDGAFDHCTSLSAVVIPNNVTVKAVAFSGCTGLRRITLSKDTVVEGKYGTAGFPRDIEVHFTGTLADWCNEATCIYTLSGSYSLYVMSNNKEKLVEDISDSTLKDVVFIRDCAFQNCKSVKRFNRHWVESITHFGKNAFADASSITYFDLQIGDSSEFRITYTWYKTADKAVWKASDVSKAEKINYLANLDLGDTDKAFAIYNKDASYYWFAIKNPE